ncbi:MAG: type III pantothenate kinase, partial [Oscillospiraceae bacterium]
MIICFDVGNTDIVFGVFEGETPVTAHRFTYTKGLTGAEYLPFLQDKMELFHIDFSHMSGCVLCCVAQNTAYELTCAMAQLFSVTPLLFKNDSLCGLQVRCGNLQEVGTDIVAGCMAAKARYSLPAIVIDMGTATTVTALDSEGYICGVSIIPGVFISLGALHEKTGLAIDGVLKAPSSPIGTDTQKSIASGVILGSAYCLDGMIKAFERELSG